MNEDVTGRRAAALETAEPVADPAEQAVADRLRAVLAHPGTWAVPTPPAAVPGQAEVVDISRRPRARRWRWVAAAGGAVAAALALVFTLVSPSGDDSLDVDMTGTALAPGARASVAATKMGPGWELVLDIDDLPGAPEGTYYEGWAVRGDTHVPLGTFHRRGPGKVKMWAGVAFDEFTRIDVTRQRVGGGQEPGEVFLSGTIPPKK